MTDIDPPAEEPSSVPEPVATGGHPAAGTLVPPRPATTTEVAPASADVAVVEPAGYGQWWVTLAGVAAVAVAVWLVVWLSAAHLPRTTDLYPVPRSWPGGMFFEGWARWDAYWYRSIVEDGYVYYRGVQSSVAYFPGYPLLLGLLQGAFPSVFVAGSVVTLGAGLTAAVLFRRWAGLFAGRPGATVAVALLVLYPYAWYLYGAVYGDALLLALAVGAFLALERDRIWLAALLGAAASATRPTGIAVAIVLVLRLLELRNAGALRWRHRLDLRSLRTRDLAIFGSFAGVLAWMGYLWVSFGDPIAFSTVQSARGWDQPSGPATWLKFGFFKNLFSNLGSSYTWSITLSAIFTALVAGLAVVVWRRIGWSYALYCLMIVGVVMVGTKDFLGSGRYLLAAFPAFAAGGMVLADRPRLRWAVPAGFGLLLLLMSSAFARGTYLA